MFHKLKNYIQTGIVALSLLPGLVFAADAYGLQDTAGSAGLTKGDTAPTPLPQLIGSYIQIFLSLLGVIFLILVIYGGFKWMNARGKTDEVTKAKDIIIDAMIGLVLIVAAYAITSFILNAVNQP